MVDWLRRGGSVVFVVLALLLGRAGADAAPWLFVTDIHLEAHPDGHRPSPLGSDTNAVLFARALGEMHAAVPNPAVVVVGGDLLAHDMTRAHATKTAIAIAHDFNRVFPRAQFILTLGNNDSNCGDYGVTPNSPFLRDVARAWAPLVNRHNAAPHFLQTFPRDGFYTATLPVAGLRAVVIDDVFWSPRYRAGCGRAGDVAADALRQLGRALQDDRGAVWVLYHIPPGVDAFSTAQVLHRLAIVPFLAPN